jgi:hypothetical protein
MGVFFIGRIVPIQLWDFPIRDWGNISGFLEIKCFSGVYRAKFGILFIVFG